MKKAEAIETLAVTLIFSPQSVQVVRSNGWIKHLVLNNEPLCPYRLTTWFYVQGHPLGEIDDYMSRHWSGDVCHNCSEIWREATWKRNGMMAERQGGD